MTAAIANALRPVDGLNVCVLVDNVTDSLSTVPQGVMHEWGHLNANGNLVLSGVSRHSVAPELPSLIR